ncbi:response regulator transcription factor [Glaciibacter psychrotolerans]|uniref:DNA-binding NarL/FixJ family response regulator n=1 Tax=Glaciibacter psychrotolerans TaxID=670054 RepID=A0A7Z0EGG3_9MICO|nr:response regulator transcription factor [Leifsonia psychrotolerans]NYJ21207.1 DNA-binding NarL/FixJ family response regulator [Leifsonia psychrotolerans]
MIDLPIRVLLVDDQALVRAGFRTILESEPGIEVVGEAGDGQAGIDAARALNPDVICMDVQMPGVDGLTATREIVADSGIRSAVLVLTTFNREDYLFEALAHGASGFLLKNATPEALIEAVQVLARGDALLAPDVTRRVIEKFSGVHGAGPHPPAAPASATAPAPAPAPNTAPVESVATVDSAPADSAAQALAELTDREAEVLNLLALGLANAEIAGRLYLGEATVKTHVSKVLLKLGLRDRVQAVVFAYEHGVVTPGATA